jgi:hypothetical protein
LDLDWIECLRCDVRTPSARDESFVTGMGVNTTHTRKDRQKPEKGRQREAGRERQHKL